MMWQSISSNFYPYTQIQGYTGGLMLLPCGRWLLSAKIQTKKKSTLHTLGIVHWNFCLTLNFPQMTLGKLKMIIC